MIAEPTPEPSRLGVGEARPHRSTPSGFLTLLRGRAQANIINDQRIAFGGHGFIAAHHRDLPLAAFALSCVLVATPSKPFQIRVWYFEEYF